MLITNAPPSTVCTPFPRRYTPAWLLDHNRPTRTVSTPDEGEAMLSRDTHVTVPIKESWTQ